jgi:hypothetical protein
MPAPAPCPERAATTRYARRQPELTVLHRTLRAHWPAFVTQAEQLGGLPKFVMREVQAYLDCGLLERGCAALECERCGKSFLVAFSCKCRGFCPSCCGRRMNDAALHLEQCVIPEVPVRQWVCSLPWQLRYVLGYDRTLCAAVLGAFVTELSRSYKRRAKREHGLPSVSQLYTGAVTFVQRVDGACRLNVHAHTVSLDGVYLRDAEQGEPRFLPLSEPTEQDVEQLAARVAARIERVLRKAGRYLEAKDGEDGHADRDDGAEDQLALAEPALSACYQAAASGQQLFGDSAGGPALRLLLGPANQHAATKKKTAPKAHAQAAQVRGVNIHASAAVPGTDRARIERLCRYAARPPLAQDRLHELPDGRVRLELKAPWADGSTAFVLEPLDLIARLVAAIPPPRFHLTRFHGVLASNSALRSLVVPKPEPAELGPATAQLPLFPPPASTPAAPSAIHSSASTEPRYKGRHPWSQLLRHVFAADVTTCIHCQGRMRLLEVAKTAEAIARVMARAGLGPQPPPAPPRPARVHPSQLPLPFG